MRRGKVIGARRLAAQPVMLRATPIGSTSSWHQCRSGRSPRRSRLREQCHFAIETKTRSFQPAHLASVRAQAAWLERRRRRWCPRAARPVLCVTRGPQLEHIADGVLVVSVNRLAQALRVGAGTVQRPEFLAPE